MILSNQQNMHAFSISQPRQPTVEAPHRWKTIDDVIVSFTIPGRISDEVWDAYLDAITVALPGKEEGVVWRYVLAAPAESVAFQV